LYTDVDGEKVSLTSQEDLDEALAIEEIQTLKLIAEAVVSSVEEVQEDEILSCFDDKAEEEAIEL
jgi:hypothetical protein